MTKKKVDEKTPKLTPKVKRVQFADKASEPKGGVPLDKEVIYKLLKDYGGNVSRVADRLGSCRGSVFRVIQSDERLKERLAQCRERMLDHLEDSAFDKAIGGDGVMTMFLLKTIGRKRGYEQDSDKQIQNVTKAAFDFVINKSKNPAE